MNYILEKLAESLKKKLVKKAMPSFEKPMLATLTKDYFNDPDWIFEKKLDGQRCLVFKNNKNVTLKSRNNKIVNTSYPELVDAVKDLDVDQIILDGEVVAFKDTISSFSKLQSRLGLKSAEVARKTGIDIYIYIFDILYLDGYELLKLPLIERKSILKNAIEFKDPLRYSHHKDEKGKEYREEACAKGLEGVIAKNKYSIYEHSRSRSWLKFKCVANQELVIAGYTDPKGSRIGFGALLLGYYKNNTLKYAGKVGTGFDDKFLADFSKKLKKIEIKKNPFDSKEMEEPDMHFVKPKYVGEIGFEEWTNDNKLRHPRFLGLRYDKDPKEVVKEQP